MEKDFWDCWLFGILFESEIGSSLVFKGGTSLSKVFGQTGILTEPVSFDDILSTLAELENRINQCENK